MYIVNIHGTTWDINTDDWECNGQDSERCADLIVQNLNELPADVVIAAYQAYANADENERDRLFNSKDSELTPIFMACDDAKAETMKGWYKIPQSGHNAEAVPVCNFPNNAS